MRKLLTTAVVAAAFAGTILSGTAPSRADGFAYMGSPKQGEFFVRRAVQPQMPAWMNARAEVPQPTARPVRGGIGLRMP